MTREEFEREKRLFIADYSDEFSDFSRDLDAFLIVHEEYIKSLTAIGAKKPEEGTETVKLKS